MAADQQQHSRCTPRQYRKRHQEDGKEHPHEVQEYQSSIPASPPESPYLDVGQNFSANSLPQGI